MASSCIRFGLFPSLKPPQLLREFCVTWQHIPALLSQTRSRISSTCPTPKQTQHSLSVCLCRSRPPLNLPPHLSCLTALSSAATHSATTTNPLSGFCHTITTHVRFDFLEALCTFCVWWLVSFLTMPVLPLVSFPHPHSPPSAHESMPHTQSQHLSSGSTRVTEHSSLTANEETSQSPLLGGTLCATSAPKTTCLGSTVIFACWAFEVCPVVHLTIKSQPAPTITSTCLQITHHQSASLCL